MISRLSTRYFFPLAIMYAGIGPKFEGAARMAGGTARIAFAFAFAFCTFEQTCFSVRRRKT